MKASNVTKAVALALSVAWAAGCSTTGGTDSGSYRWCDRYLQALLQALRAQMFLVVYLQQKCAAQQAADDAAAAAAALQSVFYFDFR